MWCSRIQSNHVWQNLGGEKCNAHCPPNSWPGTDRSCQTGPSFPHLTEESMSCSGTGDVSVPGSLRDLRRKHFCACMQVTVMVLQSKQETTTKRS